MPTSANIQARRAKFVSRGRMGGANLSGADLVQADLTNADLTGANLKGASLRSARLFQANLRGVDLTDAILEGADLLHVDFSGARWTDGQTICAEGSHGRVPSGEAAQSGRNQGRRVKPGGVRRCLMVPRAEAARRPSSRSASNSSGGKGLLKM